MESTAKLTWFGQTVTKEGEVPLGSIGAMLPRFERGPFGTNAFLDVITRRPFLGDDRFIPIGTVSRSYVLVQHGAIVEALTKAIGKAGFSPEALPCDLILSAYGERMHLDVTIPSFDFNPGDGHDMTLMATCINSVDKSCALEITMRWKRLVCMNGMARAERSDLRRIHNTDWLSADNITGYLSAQFEAAPGDLSVYKTWKETPVTTEEIETWADDVVAKEWGVFAAARTCHIARTGYDGAIEDPFEKAPPHAKRVKSEIEVPGACAPIENIFHVSQTLSWIASHRNTIEDRLLKTRDVYRLVNSLVG